MKFGEKLAKLTEERNRSKVSRDSGLPPNAVSDYINKGYLPRVDTAMALARTLGVSLDWLVDDSRDWPPPEPDAAARAGVHMLSDRELILELLRRRRLTQIELAEKLERAEIVNWRRLNHQLASIPKDQPLPRDLQLEGLLFIAIREMFPRLMGLADIRALETSLQELLPTGERKLSELEQDQLIRRYDRLAENPQLRAFMKDAGEHPRSNDDDMQLRLVAWLGRVGGKINAPAAPTDIPFASSADRSPGDKTRSRRPKG